MEPPFLMPLKLSRASGFFCFCFFNSSRSYQLHMLALCLGETRRLPSLVHSIEGSLLDETDVRLNSW